MSKNNGKSIGLDLSKFKHVSHDENSHTLKHYEGHSITLNPKKLSKANQEALNQMAQRANAKAQAVGDGKLSTNPDSYAKGGKVDSHEPNPNSHNKEGFKIKDHSYKVRSSLMHGHHLEQTSPKGEVTVHGPFQSPEKAIEHAKSQHGEDYAHGGDVKKPNIIGVKASTADKGVGAANQVHDKDIASKHGLVIEITPRDKSQNHGKIMDPRGNKPRVYADGGSVDDQVVPDDSFKAEKDAAKQLVGIDPAPMAPVTGAPSIMKDAPDLGANLPNLGSDPVTVNTGIPTPARQYEAIKQDHPDWSDKRAMDEVGFRNSVTQHEANGRAEDEANQKAEILKQAQQKQQMGIPLSEAEQQAVQSAAQPTAADTMNSPQAPVEQQTPPAPQVMGKDKGFDASKQMSRGVANQIAGTKAEAAATGEQGSREADVLNDQINNQQVLQNHYQQQYQALEKERQSHISDIQKGYINPDKYWTGYTLPNGEKVEGHSKVATGIGILLAGFNPAGRPNAALDMLEKQRDQSIEAQKQNLQSDHNLLAANMRQFGNLNDATKMTQVMMNDALVNKMNEVAAKSKDPIAQARAQEAIGKIQFDSAEKQRQVNMSQTLMNLLRSNQPGAIEQAMPMMQQVNPEMYKQYQEKRVPGIGPGGQTVYADRPVTNETRDKIQGYQDFNRAVNEAQMFADKYGGSFEGTADPRVRNQGKVIIANLGNTLRQAESMGVVKQSEMKLMDDMLGSNPANPFAAFTSSPQLRAMQHLKQAEYNSTLRNNGIRGAAPLQGAPQAPQIKVVNGVKYMRGPNGEAIPVK